MVGHQVSDLERCLSPGSGHVRCLKPCPTRWCPRELFTLSWCVYNSHFTRVYGRYSISNYLLWFINQQTSLGGGTTLQVSQHFFQLSQLFGIYVGLALEGTQKIPWHFFMEINLKASSRAEWSTSATGKKKQGCPE